MSTRELVMEIWKKRLPEKESWQGSAQPCLGKEVGSYLQKGSYRRSALLNRNFCHGENALSNMVPSHHVWRLST